MRTRRVALTLASIMVLGCATSRYVGSTSGRSSHMHASVAEALDKALSRLHWEALKWRTVSVSAATLTERTGGQSPEEVYLEEAIVQQVLASGGHRAPAPGAADVELRVLARSVGVTRTRRDLIPLYCAELIEGIADLTQLPRCFSEDARFRGGSSEENADFQGRSLGGG